MSESTTGPGTEAQIAPSGNESEPAQEHKTEATPGAGSADEQAEPRGPFLGQI